MYVFWVTLVIFLLMFGLVVFRGAPYVPSRKIYIQSALTKLYRLTNKDTLVDIGSGDGVVLRQAAKLGAKAVGYEINPILVFIARFISRKNSLVSVRMSDFWLSHLPDEATVVYVFSVTRDMQKISKWMQNETNRLGRDVHLISYGSKLDNQKSIKNLEAYNLYIFHPLQSDQA